MSGDRRPSPLLGGLRVLVIEDDPIVALTMVEGVQALGGIAVGPADTGADALRLLARARPHLVLLGVRPRDTAATEVAEALLERRLPFGIVTAKPLTTWDEAPLRNAPRLVKPFDKRMLRRLLLELAQWVEPSMHRVRAYDLGCDAGQAVTPGRLPELGQAA